MSNLNLYVTTNNVSYELIYFVSPATMTNKKRFFYTKLYVLTIFCSEFKSDSDFKYSDNTDGFFYFYDFTDKKNPILYSKVELKNFSEFKDFISKNILFIQKKHEISNIYYTLCEDVELQEIISLKTNFIVSNIWKSEKLYDNLFFRLTNLKFSEDKKKISDLLSEADALDKNAFRRKEKLYKKIIKKFPKYIDGYYYLILLYFNFKNYLESYNCGKEIIHNLYDFKIATIKRNINCRKKLMNIFAESKYLSNSDSEKIIENKSSSNLNQDFSIQEFSNIDPVISKNINIKFNFNFNYEDVLSDFQNNNNNSKDILFHLINTYKLSLFNSFDELLCLEEIDIIKFDYQILTVKKVLKNMAGRCLLSDEVGLGKTIEAALILKEYHIRGLIESALILTPPNLVHQWHNELSNKFNMKFSMLLSQKKFDFINNKFIITSLSLAKGKRYNELFLNKKFDIVIVDEAHHLKNKSTINWKFVNKINSKYMLLLTATPIQNSIFELFNIVTLLKPGLLGTQKEFKSNFIVKLTSNKIKNEEKLHDLLSEVMIRNNRSNVDVEFVPRNAEIIYVNLSDTEKQFYIEISNYVKDHYPFYNNENNTKWNALRFVLQLLQKEAGSSVDAAVLTLKKLLHSSNIEIPNYNRLKNIFDLTKSISNQSKIIALKNIISNNDEKFIIFTQYVQTLKLIYNELSNAGLSVVSFSGSMSLEEKNNALKQFENEAAIFVSTQSGSEGRNLQFCRNLINYDMPWNPMQIEQRIGRIHRIGQKEQVNIYNLSAAGTIESYILKILDAKINMFQLVIGEMDMILGDIDGKDFEKNIFDIWINSKNDDDYDKNFEEYGDVILNKKKKYINVKKIDDKIFGNKHITE